jgi:hypothetical protein
MSDLYWLTNEQMSRVRPYFPNSHGNPRVDDRRVLSGIVSSIATGCDGAMRRNTMARTRRCTIAGSAGVRWAFSSASWKDWLRRMPIRRSS